MVKRDAMDFGKIQFSAGKAERRNMKDKHCFDSFTLRLSQFGLLTEGHKL